MREGQKAEKIKFKRRWKNNVKGLPPVQTGGSPFMFFGFFFMRCFIYMQLFFKRQYAGFTLTGNLTDIVFQVLEWRFSCRGRK